MNRLVVVSLRATLIVLFLGLLLAQVLSPIVATGVGQEYYEVTHLALPYAVLAMLGIACIEVALVVVWRLLSMVSSGQVFTERALRWVDAITISAAVATALAIAVAIHLIGIVQLGGPGVVLALGACIAAGVALVLLMIVLRSLLQSAIAYRSELAEVI